MAFYAAENGNMNDWNEYLFSNKNTNFKVFQIVVSMNLNTWLNSILFSMENWLNLEFKIGWMYIKYKVQLIISNVIVSLK
jgi:hypothetical protein